MQQALQRPHMGRAAGVNLYQTFLLSLWVIPCVHSEMTVGPGLVAVVRTEVLIAKFARVAII